MIHVLALLAKAGHGKTTTANYLVNEYGAKTVSLAAPLKKIAKAVMNFGDEQLWGTQAQKESLAPPTHCGVDERIPGAVRNAYGDLMSARIFLQKLGTEGLRTFIGPTVFLDALVHSIATDYAATERARGADAVYIVDDARFINEVAFIQALTHRDGLPKFFGTAIKLVCEDAPPSGNDAHASEAEVDRIPADLLNATVVSRLNPKADNIDADPADPVHGYGVNHLIGQVEEALTVDKLANLRGALQRSRTAKALRDRRAA